LHNIYSARSSIIHQPLVIFRITSIP
jgi:hypothetical protein